VGGGGREHSRKWFGIASRKKEMYEKMLALLGEERKERWL